MADYNGWKNRSTWNVALWINNDEGIYRAALRCRTYAEFVDVMRECGSLKTPDGYDWDSEFLDTDELDALILENRGGK